MFDFSNSCKARRIPFALTLLFCLFASLLSVAHAQTATGGIRGVANDANGAAVPNATVMGKNTATGVDLKTTTDA